MVKIYNDNYNPSKMCKSSEKQKGVVKIQPDLSEESDKFKE